MRDMSGLIEAVTEICNPPFSVIVEMMLNEETQWLDLKDWETNQQRWGKDDQDRMIGSKDFALPYEDIEKTVVPGASISKTKNIFLPLPFSIPKEEAVEIMRRILAFAKQNGSVTVSTWPAYGVEGTSAYPAQVVKKLPADDRSVAQQVGLGGAIYAIDGHPISRVMTMPMPIGTDDEKLSARSKIDIWANVTTDESGNIISAGGRGRGDEGPPPDWLIKLISAIDSVIRSGEVKVELSRMKGFQREIIFSTDHGDSVLVLSKERSKAAYLFRKKMDLNGTPTDYDVAVSQMMTEFQRSYKRRPRGVKRTGETDPVPQNPNEIIAAARRAQDQLRRAGEQQDAGPTRQPKLLLRDWLKKTNNGYALRRDFRAEDILKLLSGGINYEDGRRVADLLADLDDNIDVDDEYFGQMSAPEDDMPEVEMRARPDGRGIDAIPKTPDTKVPGVEAFEDKLEWAMAEPITEDVDSYMSIIERPWSVDDKGLFKFLESSDSSEVENWVNALDIAVNERNLGNRWVFALVEQTHEKLAHKMPVELRPIVIGMLEQIQAAPYPKEEDVPGPDLPPEPPKKSDWDDDYNPEAFQR